MMRHIFIVGFAHSGTSLLLAMLGAHSQLHALKNESWIFVGPAHEDERIKAYFEPFYREAERLGKAAIVEKSPPHMAYVALIENLYPEAKIIFTLRNSLDIIGSYKRRYQDIHLAVWRYAHQLVSFVKNFVVGRHFLVRYETLVESPEDTLRTLCAWLDIPYEKAMLEFHQNNDNWFGRLELKKTSGILTEHTDYRNWQMHQPLFNGANRYGEWLSENECAYLQAEAGTLFSVLDRVTERDIPPQEQMLCAATEADWLACRCFFKEVAQKNADRKKAGRDLAEIKNKYEAERYRRLKMKSSLSWKITAPVRIIGRALGLPKKK
jgi:hypothetical protein